MIIKAIEQQIQIGDLLLIFETRRDPVGYSFSIEKIDGGDSVIGSTYEGEINIEDLEICIKTIKNLSKEDGTKEIN